MPLHELMAYLSWWALPIAYAFSVGCCCAVPSVDTNDSCSSFCNTDWTPDTWQMTFDGVTNDNCSNCGDWNTTTFLLPFNSGAPCLYLSDPLDNPDCGTFFNGVCQIEFVISSGQYGWSITRAITGGDCPLGGGRRAEATGSVSVTTPRNCADDVFTGQSVSNGSHQLHCEWGSATWDLQAV